MKRELSSQAPVDSTLAPLFGAAVAQRTANVELLREPKRQFQEGGLQSAMSGQRSRLDSLLKGPSLSHLMPYNTGNLLEDFRTRDTTPIMNGRLPLRELTTNFTHPVMRIAKPHSSSVEAASKFELVMEYNDDEFQLAPLRTGAGYLQSAPMSVLNLATFNETVYNQQLYDARVDHELYLTRDPSHYMEGWSVGGVVEFEQMLNGAESLYSGGFRGGSMGGMRQTAAGYKLLTVTSKGPAFMYNIFGDNICAGGRCFLIFKKHPVPSQFVLSSKYGFGTGGDRGVLPPVVHRSGSQSILPYMMSAVCLPAGGRLPAEATAYYDERGNLRYDALVISLGRIFSTPIGHAYKHINNLGTMNPITKQLIDKDESGSAAYTDATRGISRDDIMLMKLILDPDDGIAP